MTPKIRLDYTTTKKHKLRHHHSKMIFVLHSFRTKGFWFVFVSGWVI